MPAAAALARRRASVMAPLATAAPSVLTASPIHAPATSGWCTRKASAAKGRTLSSTTANSTTSDETVMAPTGRARIAAAAAIDADPPQLDMPDASGAAHAGVRRKTGRARRYG